MTNTTHTFNDVTLTESMIKALGSHAIGNPNHRTENGWLTAGHGITIGALIRRGLAEKIADQGYRITDAGRAWLTAYEAEHAAARAASLQTAKELRARIASQKAAAENRDAAARAEGYESAADKECEEARAEELDHDVAPAEPQCSKCHAPDPLNLHLLGCIAEDDECDKCGRSGGSHAGNCGFVIDNMLSRPATAEPPAYEPRATIWALVAYIEGANEAGRWLSNQYKTGFYRALREAVRSDALEQGIPLTDGELTTVVINLVTTERK